MISKFSNVFYLKRPILTKFEQIQFRKLCFFLSKIFFFRFRWKTDNNGIIWCVWMLRKDRFSLSEFLILGIVANDRVQFSRENWKTHYFLLTRKIFKILHLICFIVFDTLYFVFRTKLRFILNIFFLQKKLFYIVTAVILF